MKTTQIELYRLRLPNGKYLKSSPRGKRWLLVDVQQADSFALAWIQQSVDLTVLFACVEAVS